MQVACTTNFEVSRTQSNIEIARKGARNWREIWTKDSNELKGIFWIFEAEQLTIWIYPKIPWQCLSKTKKIKEWIKQDFYMYWEIYCFGRVFDPVKHVMCGMVQLTPRDDQRTFCADHKSCKHIDWNSSLIFDVIRPVRSKESELFFVDMTGNL